MNNPSIFRSLMIRCGIGVGLLLVALSMLVYLLVRHSLNREVDRMITDVAGILANQIEIENGHVVFEWQEGLGTNVALTPAIRYQFWEEKTGKTSRSPSLGEENLPRFTGRDGTPELREIILPDGSLGRAIGLRAFPYMDPDAKSPPPPGSPTARDVPHILVVAADVKYNTRTLARLRYLLITGTVLALGITFALIRHAIQRSLEPLGLLGEQMRCRTGEMLDTPLQFSGGMPTELTGLAADFDHLLARVARLRVREKSFIRQAAHELRTPIAALASTTELALSRKRDAAAYQGYLATCDKTAREMSELVKRLSTLARIGGNKDGAIRPVELSAGEVFHDCLRRFLPQLEDRGMILETTLPADLPNALADRTLLTLIFNNLLDNAVSYAPPGCRIDCRFSRSAEEVIFQITNPAPDLPADLSRLFEPLFRNNPHGGGGDHLGIGLTISQEAAAATGAQLTAQADTPDNLTFTLTLPMV